MPLTPAQLENRIEAVRFDIPDVLDPWHSSSRVEAPLVFTFKFETSEPSDLGGTFTGWTAFSASEKAAILAALAEYQDIININFQQIAGADADISFGSVDMSPGLGGFGGFRYSYSSDGQGNVTSRDWDAFAVYNNSIDLQNPRDMNLILHEIGHALGLKHPGDYDAGGQPTPPPYLPAAEDNNQYSVMSYNDHPETGGVSPHLMVYDIAALQALWGANYNTRAGNTVYFGPGAPTGFAAVNGASPVICIWDGGGRDTFDFRHYSSSLVLDLNPGAFSSVGSFDNTISIAYGAIIENAKGGSAGDNLAGNAAANSLYGLGGDDSLAGASGKDHLLGGIGKDSISGGGGNDDLEGGEGGDRLNGGTGRDTFSFSDIAESSLTAGGRDVIAGFNANGQDRIDLSGIAPGGVNPDFEFIGNADFTALGQIRAYEDGALTIVDINCQGNRVADMRIQLTGHIVLDGSDFVL